jgi:hypothetical protein
MIEVDLTIMISKQPLFQRFSDQYPLLSPPFRPEESC